jgi:hypothetical protein
MVHCVSSALPIGGGGHRCANILTHTNVPCAYSIGGPMPSEPIVMENRCPRAITNGTPNTKYGQKC